MQKTFRMVFILLLCGIFIQNKLYQVVSLARHGARYHTYNLGNSSQTQPLKNQLTAVGMRQHQKLGNILRKQYINELAFLKSTYDSNQIVGYSTSINRTRQSLLSFYYGLYPPGTGPKIDFVDQKQHLPPYNNQTDLKQQNFALPMSHQQIKIYTDGKILPENCPNYEIFKQRNFQIISQDLAQMNLTYFPLLTKISKIYQISNPKFQSFVEVYDILHVDSYLGRPWPTNITEADFLNLKHLANWYYHVTMMNNNTILSNTGKLQKMFSVFDTRIRVPDSSMLKWIALSAHDTDIIGLYLALDLSSANCIEQLYRRGQTSALNCEQQGVNFATNIIIQLYSFDKIDFFVKVRSNGKYMYLCGKKSYTCEYSEFKNKSKGYITNNLDEYCGRKISSKKATVI